MNEELVTVNAELQGKVSDPSLANNGMNNLLAGTLVGMVFVNHQLRIQRCTPENLAGKIQCWNATALADESGTACAIATTERATT